MKTLVVVSSVTRSVQWLHLVVIFISPVGVSRQGGTPWVDRRSAEIIICHYLHS